MIIRRKEGVTLIEVMVVVAIVGMLAAIAIPAYNDYVTRSRRSDAFTALETVRAAQEMYRAEKGEYADIFNRLAGCSAGMAGNNYNLILAAIDSDANGSMDQYTIDAQPQEKQTGDFQFRIDQNGVQWYDGGSGWDNDKNWEDLRKP